MYTKIQWKRQAKCDKHFTNKYCFENKLKATENGFYHSGQGWYLSKPAVLKQGDMTEGNTEFSKLNKY